MTPPTGGDGVTQPVRGSGPAMSGLSRRPRHSTWSVPAALVALTVLPVAAGSLRLLEVAGGPVLLPDNPRIDASPAPLVLHVAAAALFALVGAFQFSAPMRSRHPRWHRRSGRVLVVAGLTVAVTGLWMTLFYSRAPGGDLLWAVRLVVGCATAASIVVAFSAIRRRDIPHHRAWMMRAYALAAGAGTQFLTQGFGEAWFGAGDLSKALSMTSGWVVNLAIAEWIIRRPAHIRRRRRRSEARATVVRPT